ncbi:proteinase inhibitor I4 serpin [Xylanimonas cellulosilytica DSM 15894]|uniref:Proteinase inhibitor I4 serpin n=2 Tax=Xylanimonas TaxID=186188 RepID=D1BTD7_XYLCX|nr:proteinase inhibitor I4 serpin [Xylanimonas cellulosilytica DSM 15894]
MLVADGVEARQVAVSDAGAAADVVGATRRIGAALLVASPADANAVVSPSSVAVALSMLADGARGGTLAELDQVLGATGEDRRDAVAALRGTLLRHDGDPAVVRDEELPDDPVVHLAAQVVVDDQLTPDDAYLTTLADVYGAGVQRVDLGSDDGKSALDAWVQHHSGGLVEESAITPKDSLRLVLQDAVVLAARWYTPFPGHATGDRPFTTADGTEVSVPTMSGEAPRAYAEVDGWRAARLPYTGHELHADVILPPDGVNPAAAHPELLAALAAALDDAEDQPVRVTLPVLDLRPDPLDLRDAIATLGAPTVLDPGAADLTGIGTDDAGERLYLGQAMQQAVLQLDEEGTRAAAVTELGAEAGSAPVDRPVELTLDRPFLIEIAHTSTSWPLFQAAIRDPRPGG